ncbi:MAG: transcriptional repressor [Ruminococcus sp.]|nr:transcriptional repressor [Ruminococcus sp.]
MKRDSGYNTKQKEKLLELLISNSDRHISVAEIGAFFASEGSPLGTATIYRQLDKLVERGVVRKYSFDGKTGACYQYIEDASACREHFHLKCLSCGRLIHLDCQHLMGINQHIAQHHGFYIDPAQTVFYGKCADCAEKEDS